MIAIIIQARMGSTRLPGKALKLLHGKPMLLYVVERCRQSKKAHTVAIATTDLPEDSVIAEFCNTHHIPCYRGSPDDVLNRYYHCAKNLSADTIVRITSDCPLIAPELIDECLSVFETGSFDYVSNTAPGERELPRGLDVEVLSFSALELAEREAKEPYEREHVTPYLSENRAGNVRVSPIVVPTREYLRPYRLTVDYPEDFLMMETIYGIKKGRRGLFLRAREAIAFLDAHPEVCAQNVHCLQKTVK
ncbi:MAG: acylneuraminate cytidylyltransferase [Parcubacteria group bacterium Greene0416_79]|nr:MAG: acylneuraminate cytidylyltransferase [Parcubacteria group bacterium Greene0416_79]